jgi:hypothetical protein
MTALTSLWKWLFRDKRSAWEIKQEREFIEAVNGLKNYTVTGLGGVSMDPEEIRDYVIARRQELSHLVDPKHRETPSFGTGHASGACVEVISWRSLSDQAAIRYVCLQALDGRGFCVASARYFSAEDTVPVPDDVDRQVAQKLMGKSGELPLEWHPTLAAALEAHDRAI